MNPIKLELSNPANVVFACNPKGGIGKTTAVSEGKTACELRGIPARLATFDRYDKTLGLTFRDENLVTRLDLDTLPSVIDEIKETKSLLWVDMPAAFTDPGLPFMKALAASTIFQEFHTISVIIPITPDANDIKCALDVLAAFERIGMKINHGMVRAWNNQHASRAWESFPNYNVLAKMYPVWKCETWMQSMSEMMHQHGDFAEFPAPHLWPQYLIDEGPKLSTNQRCSLRAAVAHLERANTAIYESILQHITRPVAEHPGDPANRLHEAELTRP